MDHSVCRTFGCIALFAVIGSATAQDYPTKPINMIVPFPPGGVADLTGRPTAIAMEKILRQPVLVVNRPGAGGAVGNALVGKGATDGYTILMALSSISVIPEAERSCKRAAPYDLNQFAPIALISADPTVLAVRSESPYRSVRDLVEAARKAPEKLSFSSSAFMARCTCLLRCSRPRRGSSSITSLIRVAGRRSPLWWDRKWI